MNDPEVITGRMRPMPTDPAGRKRTTCNATITILGLIAFAELCALSYLFGAILGNNI